MSLALLVVISNISVLSYAQAEQDRRALVTAVYHHLPHFLKWATRQKAFDELSDSEKSAINQVVALNEQTGEHHIRLKFDNNPENFRLQPDQDPRLMITSPELKDGALADSEISVNLQLLNSPNTVLSVSQMFKLLFHELAHKTDIPNWGVRDNAAQTFENLISMYSIDQDLTGTQKLHIVSIAADKLDASVAQTSLTEPQPTNLILLETSSGFIDLTPSVIKVLSASNAGMRPFMSELSRIFYALGNPIQQLMQAVIGGGAAPFMQQITQQINQQFGPLLQAFGVKMPEISADSFKIPTTHLGEIRKLEIHEVSSIPVSADYTWVTLKSTFVMARDSSERNHVSVNGVNWEGIYRVPLQIYLTIPNHPADASAVRVEAIARADFDYDNKAKLGPINRSGGQMRISVILPAEKKPKTLELSARYSGGYLSISADQIGEPSSGKVQAEFVIPNFITKNEILMMADRLMIDSARSVYLDRALTLNQIANPNAGSSNITSVEPKNIVADSFGVWGIHNGNMQLRTHFTNENPALLLDYAHPGMFTIQPSRFKIEFQTRSAKKIKEIRLTINRSIITSIPEDGEAGLTDIYFSGEMVRFCTGKSNSPCVSERLETISFKTNHIYRADEEVNGEYKVIAETTIPFWEGNKPAQPGSGYTLPFARLVGFEVVTEDLQTEVYELQNGKVPDFNIDLKDLAKAFTNCNINLSAEVK